MKIAVTGAYGMLGRDLMAELDQRGHDAVGLGHHQMDVTDAEAVKRVLGELRPDAVIHCAAHTAVDAAESDKAACTAVNTAGTANVAAMCADAGSKLIYVSTDYVFDGSGTKAWRPFDTPAPLNHYGHSKRGGEKEILKRTKNACIVRASWLFGAGGNNFVHTMLELFRGRSDIRVVDDQIGRPTYTRDFSLLLADMAESDAVGVFHASGTGTYASRYELACETLNLYGSTKSSVIPVSTDQYPTPAARPLNSRLDTSNLAEGGFGLLPDWHDALKRYLKEVL